MSRDLGLLPISANFEPAIATSFDARSRTALKTDLYNAGTYGAYAYAGMLTSVYGDTTDNNGLYILKSLPSTTEANWEKVGTGESGPVGDEVLVNNDARVSSSSLSTDLTHNGIKEIQFTSGSTMNFGDVCYIASNGKMTLGDASAIATAKIVAMNVTASQIVADDTGNYLIESCLVRNDAWNFNIGEFVYLSTTGTTGNTLTQVAPQTVVDECVVVVGIATSSDIIYFNPQLVIVQVNGA